MSDDNEASDEDDNTDAGDEQHNMKAGDEKEQDDGIRFIRRVSQFIESFRDDSASLPLTHITPLCSIRMMSLGESIAPKYCKNIKDYVTYFFYGRPSFRMKDSADPSLTWNNPVLFVLEPDAAISIKRVFPFDSGAFLAGRYSDVFPPDSDLKYFELSPSISSAKKMVTAFYDGSNHKYFFGRSAADNQFNNFDFELQGLQYLARRPVTPNHDERSSSIEVQLDQEILIKDVKYILVPETLLTDEFFLNALKKWNIDRGKVKSYTNAVSTNATIWVGALYEKLRSIYESEGIIL